MRPALLSALLLFGGCSLLGSDSDALFITDAERYDVRQVDDRYEAAISFEYVNTKPGTVYLPGCRGPAPWLQKQTGEGWETAFAPAVAACLGPSVRVRPGETYRDTLHVIAGIPGSNRGPQFQVPSIDGIYRVVIPIDRTKDPENIKLLPLTERVSQPFELREVTD